MVPQIIFVGTERGLCDQVGALVSSLSSLELTVLPSLRVARSALRVDAVCLLVLHLKEVDPCTPVLDLLHEQAARVGPPIVVLTDRADPALKLELLRSGAVECLSRPLNLNRLAFVTDLLTLRARQAFRPSEARVHSAFAAVDFDGWMMSTHGCESLLDQVRKVSARDSTILLTGETGAGKSLLAKVIHQLSPRSARPFLSVNCGALHSTLIESELFGHRRGAFTGADQDVMGKLTAVGDGTLLLDEVDSLPLETQPKLLRVIDERIFEPVGSTSEKHLNARLICAANTPLEKAVDAGRFRSDLYFRLNVIALHIPPLRQRMPIIAPLAQRMLNLFSVRDRGMAMTFSETALVALETYDWPGNMRELRNVVEYSVTLADSEVIDVDDLPQRVQDGCAAVEELVQQDYHSSNQLANVRNAAERERLVDVLQRQRNNRSGAARELGISRVTLYKKLRQFGL